MILTGVSSLGPGHWNKGYPQLQHLTLLGGEFFWFYEVQKVDIFLKMTEN